MRPTRAPFTRRPAVGLDEEFVPSRHRDPNYVPVGRVTGQAKVVNAPSGLRLRTKPVDGETMATMPEGTVVGVGPSGVSGWLFVRYSSQYGYASADYLEPIGASHNDDSENVRDLGDVDDPNFLPKPGPSPGPKPGPSPGPSPVPPPTPEGEDSTVPVALIVAGTAVGAALLVYLVKRYSPSHAF